MHSGGGDHLAEPFVERRVGTPDARPAVAATGDDILARASQAIAAEDLQGGPDYVDAWMEKNLAPGVVALVQNCCTSFLRWELLRQLHAARTELTPEYLARTVGASLVTASNELQSLTSLGLVSRCQNGKRTTYRLEYGSPLARALDIAIRAYAGNRDFRFAVVYSIVRANHLGAEAD